LLNKIAGEEPFDRFPRAWHDTRCGGLAGGVRDGKTYKAAGHRLEFERKGQNGLDGLKN
jgi:hypothetical protein